MLTTTTNGIGTIAKMPRARATGTQSASAR